MREKAEKPKPRKAQPASMAQLMLALMNMDPLAQETMIAHRLATLPTGQDGKGPPANIPRMIRGPWAHHLRKLGVFCIPELATHEVVEPDAKAAGVMVRHTAAEMAPVTVDSIWERVKQMNPELATDVDAARKAKDPRKRMELMNRLYAQMPADQRAVAQRLMRSSPDELTPR